MKIRKIQIDEFGLWRNLQLELDPERLTVLYGPNETGKSTLLRFIRGVLYGFHASDATGIGARPAPVACGGSIDAVNGDSLLTIRRTRDAGADGHLAVLGVPDSSEAELRSILQVGEGMFHRVFAIGLDELQRLATLQDGEVGEFIYQTTLGPRGERLVAACRRGEQARQKLLSRDGTSGAVRELLAKIGVIDRAIADFGDPLERHAALEQEQRAIEDDIADQRRRIDGLNEQLRGHAFLDRVWRPWQRHQQLQAELDALDEFRGFPEDGISKLEQWNRDEADLVRHCRRLKRERRRLRDELKRLAADSRFSECAESIRDVIECWDEIAPDADKLPALRNELQTRRQQADDALRNLGPNWTIERVRSVKTPPEGSSELLAAASAYRSAIIRRKRLLRRYQAFNTNTQQEQVAVNQRLGADPDATREQMSQRISLLQELRQTHNEAVVARSTKEALEKQSVAAEDANEFPPYFLMALTVFGVGGVVLILLGLVGFVRGWSSTAPMLTGAILALLGICCAGVSWTMKRQFDPATHDHDDWQQRLNAAHKQHSQLQDQLEELRDILPDDDQFLELDESAASALIDQHMNQALADLTDLDKSIERRNVLADRRRRLSDIRERIREQQRHVANTRRSWCRALADAGLEESLRIVEVFDIWEQAGRCRRAYERVDQVSQDIERRQRSLDRLRERIERIAAAVGMSPDECQASAETLESWRARLVAAEQTAERRSEMRSQFKAVRSDFVKSVSRLNALRQQRQALLAAGGADDAAEFRERHAQFLRRRQLADQIEATRADLESAASADSDLAVVEEDLIQFDEEENRRAIATIESELQDLEGDVQVNHEKLGDIHRQIEDTVADGRFVELRFERAQLIDELEQLMLRLQSTQAAAAVLEELRDELELRNQPRTLQGATDYLVQLTAGKYVRVWTSIGERRLVVDEASGRSLLVEQLSNGTREQLYLAIRLSLIGQLRAEGVHLPLVLDDVLVNFDETRTNAAVDTLAGISATGQQILLFTCHRHLARDFQSRGADLIELPRHDLPALERRVG